MAHHRLRLFIEEAGWSHERAARELGCSRSLVSYIITGAKRPGLDIAHAIERMTTGWARGAIRTEEWLSHEHPSDDADAAPLLSTSSP